MEVKRGPDGSVLDVGRRRRTVGWRLRKALDVRAPRTADAGLGNWHRQEGIDPWTATSLWQGDPLDLDWALWVLWGQYDRTPLKAA